MSIVVKRYDKQCEPTWNTFVNGAKNATFLFNRSYMDYHSDRFVDHSILIYIDGNLIAILPANEKSGEIISHGGLSYGGLVVTTHVKLTQVARCFFYALKYFHEQGIKTIIYKTFPTYLTNRPSEEDLYALYLLQATLLKRDTACVVSLGALVHYQHRRVRSIRKAAQDGGWVRQTDDPTFFWDYILSPTLYNRHGLKPVHSIKEIKLLMSRFPENITCYESGVGHTPTAGTLIFETATTAHAQYIATTAEGRTQGTLDFLFDHLLKSQYAHKAYFSFGISNETNSTLNNGLQDWKEGFGASTFALDFFSIETANYHLLEAYV